MKKTHAAPTPSGTRVQPATTSFFNRVIATYGTPRVEGATSPREEATGLLQLAAEIEHSLMVQYLYAAASVRPDAGISARNKVLSVAVQEMGHLMAVQNLLLLVGETDALHFGRDGIRAGSGNSPIPLVLEPVSATALAKFIIAEMPANIGDPALRTRVDDLMRIAEQSAGTTPHRVRALCAKLFWLFQSDDRVTPPLDLVPDEKNGLKAGWHLDPGGTTAPIQSPYAKLWAELFDLRYNLLLLDLRHARRRRPRLRTGSR